MKNILRVRNLAQKVLWDQELSGQLSDGHWENATPWDHWKPWCDATIVVDPEHVGKNFHARREAYMFNDKRLLDVVGDRMLDYVRVATGDATYDAKRMNKDLVDLRKIIKEWVSDSVPIPEQPTSVSLSQYYFEGDGRYAPYFGNVVAVFDQDSAQALARKVLDTIPDSPKPKWTKHHWASYDALVRVAGAPPLGHVKPGRTYTMADFDPALA